MALILISGIFSLTISSFSASAQVEKAVNSIGSYYDDSPQTASDNIMAPYITVNSDNRFIITATAKEIGVDENVYNNKLDILADMNNLADEDYIFINNDKSVNFTQKYVDSIREHQKPSSYIYLETNKVIIDDGSNDGGVNQFVWNQGQCRYELFCTHDTTVAIVAAIGVVDAVINILSSFVPGGAIISKIANGICTLAIAAITIKNKEHGVVFLINSFFVPYWVCTQA